MSTNQTDCPRNDDRDFNSANNLTPEDQIALCRFTTLVLDISTLLLESGAHCERINQNIQRIAANTPYRVELLLSFTGISISVSDDNNILNTITKTQRIKHHGAHFGVLTSMSLLTWKLLEQKMSFADFTQESQKLKKSNRYPLWLVRISIGIACACLCIIAGGNWLDGLFVFIASTIGITVRQEMLKRGYNLMVCVTSSSFVTSLICGFNVLFSLGAFPASSVATSVLFLIPGVPLINCLIDLIEGYIPTALSRGAFSASILLCIAIGMFLSMNLIGINNF